MSKFFYLTFFGGAWDTFKRKINGSEGVSQLDPPMDEKLPTLGLSSGVQIDMG